MCSSATILLKCTHNAHMPWNIVYTIKTRLTAYLRIMEEMRFCNNLHQVKNVGKPNNLKAVRYVNQTGLNNIAKNWIMWPMAERDWP